MNPIIASQLSKIALTKPYPTHALTAMPLILNPEMVLLAPIMLVPKSKAAPIKLIGILVLNVKMVYS